MKPLLELPSSLKKERGKKEKKSSEGSLHSAREGGLSLIWNRDLKKEKEEDEEGGGGESRGGLRGAEAGREESAARQK